MTQTTLTCPDCGTKTESEIHDDKSVVAYECKGCEKTIKAKDGLCCVHCSFGDKRCPVSVLDETEEKEAE